MVDDDEEEEVMMVRWRVEDGRERAVGRCWVGAGL